MKKSISGVVYIVLIVAVMAVAIMAYNHFSKGYVPQNLPPVAEDETVSESDADSAPSATDFTVYDRDKNPVTLHGIIYDGKPVIVNFWATWCGPCKKEMPHFEEFYKDNRDEINFMFINQTDGSRETYDTVAKFMSDTGYTFPVYYDTTFSASLAYSVRAIPTTLFIDAKGDVAYTYSGTMSKEALEIYAAALTDRQ